MKLYYVATQKPNGRGMRKDLNGSRYIYVTGNLKVAKQHARVNGMRLWRLQFTEVK